MKLKPKLKLQSPRKEKIFLDGSLAASVDAYAKYYEDTYKEKMEVSEMLTEMLKAFLKSDRDFIKWKTKSLDSVET